MCFCNNMPVRVDTALYEEIGFCGSAEYVGVIEVFSYPIKIASIQGKHLAESN